MIPNEISRRKPPFPLTDAFRAYLRHHDRDIGNAASYEELRHFRVATPLEDAQGRDTLWLSVGYAPEEREGIHRRLVETYVTLRAEGAATVAHHLSVERVDFCSFGNSQPFRIRIVNRFNDNYDHFYVKQADASRLFGLELEHLLSPNRIGFLVENNTLIEEHIAGVPGDRFIADYLSQPQVNKVRLAKEFVKFNERCFLRLLGDMRAQNYVVDITPDFEDEQYRIRSIDFDQQCYEGRLQLYQPHRWENNRPVLDFCLKFLNSKSVRQYQYEERALLARRYKEEQRRADQLLNLLCDSVVSTPRKTRELAQGLAQHHGVDQFLQAQNMGQILKLHLRLCLAQHLRVLGR